MQRTVFAGIAAMAAMTSVAAVRLENDLQDQQYVEVDTEIDTGIDAEVDTEIDTGIDTGIDTKVDTEIGTEIDTEVDTEQLYGNWRLVDERYMPSDKC